MWMFSLPFLLRGGGGDVIDPALPAMQSPGAFYSVIGAACHQLGPN